MLAEKRINADYYFQRWYECVLIDPPGHPDLKFYDFVVSPNDEHKAICGWQVMLHFGRFLGDVGHRYAVDLFDNVAVFKAGLIVD